MRTISPRSFQILVHEFYADNRRTLPWRNPDQDGTFDPYKILLSELMLQQTQVNRVTIKYHDFLQTFPDIATLAQAPLADVLRMWSGLGYNRRARFLHQSAAIIHQAGTFPTTQEQLIALPGVGANTAGAILAYAYNKPTVFIETNIRTVYLHHFFAHSSDVSDRQLLPLIEKTLDTHNPRQWYWALMDYGTFLKAEHSNPSRRSRHHTKQSTFEGSRRQLRGRILKLLIEQNYEYSVLANDLSDPRLDAVLKDMIHEGLVSKVGQVYQLGK